MSQHSSLQQLKCEQSSWCGSSYSPRTLGVTWSACCLCKIKLIKATLASKVSLWPPWCNLGLDKLFSPLFNGILISFLPQVCTMLCSWACCKILDYNSNFCLPTSPFLSPFGFSLLHCYHCQQRDADQHWRLLRSHSSKHQTAALLKCTVLRQTLAHLWGTRGYWIRLENTIFLLPSRALGNLILITVKSLKSILDDAGKIKTNQVFKLHTIVLSY